MAPGTKHIVQVRLFSAQVFLYLSYPQWEVGGGGEPTLEPGRTASQVVRGAAAITELHPSDQQ